MGAPIWVAGVVVSSTALELITREHMGSLLISSSIPPNMAFFCRLIKADMVLHSVLFVEGSTNKKKFGQNSSYRFHGKLIALVLFLDPDSDFTN
ncbi:uncharacterized protein B0T23DRAFT_371717 [Neurospora hispaniola]|uniref:Uncharacterized protein n=1 Tax=Neurospora hispaniola TaxID=588809 RepID=A0AAJ0MVX5_9PEZI|nr:hypothetical protein B0T23DRAFT_371717 [Neurospora hispaniola]